MSALRVGVQRRQLITCSQLMTKYGDIDTSPAMPDHTVLPATQHRWTRPALTPANQLDLPLFTPIVVFLLLFRSPYTKQTNPYTAAYSQTAVYRPSHVLFLTSNSGLRVGRQASRYARRQPSWNESTWLRDSTSLVECHKSCWYDGLLWLCTVHHSR